MADVDAALEQQVLNVAQGQRVADVRHDDQPDHFRRRVKPAKRVVGLIRTGHFARLNPTPYWPVHLN
jgi:hypothetical protein